MISANFSFYFPQVTFQTVGNSLPRAIGNLLLSSPLFFPFCQLPGLPWIFTVSNSGDLSDKQTSLDTQLICCYGKLSFFLPSVSMGQDERDKGERHLCPTLLVR